jgi:hypothetical protein
VIQRFRVVDKRGIADLPRNLPSLPSTSPRFLLTSNWTACRLWKFVGVVTTETPPDEMQKTIQVTWKSNFWILRDSPPGEYSGFAVCGCGPNTKHELRHI